MSYTRRAKKAMVIDHMCFIRRLRTEEMGEAERKSLETAVYNQFSGLITHVMRKLKTKGVKSLQKEDLEQEAAMSLLNAIRKYNPDSKSKFITYAYTAVKNGIMKAIRGKDALIRVPFTSYKTCYLVSEFAGGEDMTDKEMSELAAFLQCSNRQTRNVLFYQKLRECGSLDADALEHAAFCNDPEHDFFDGGDFKVVSGHEAIEDLVKIAGLDEDDKNILAMLFGFDDAPLPPRLVAKEFLMSTQQLQSRVRKILTELKKRMKMESRI